MKLKIKKYKAALTIPVFVGILGLFFACNDEWKEHYDNKSAGGEESLLSVLKQDPELSMFVKMVEISGLSQAMNGTEAYTVWAPADEALKAQGISLENLSAADSARIVTMTKNHIARYFYSTSEIEFNRKRILMLSTKYIYFEKAGNQYSFDEQPLTVVNSICTNGVLHKLNGTSKYRDNLWEYIKNTADLKSVYDFIIKYDSTYLDLNRSKAIGINDEGYTIYDSVKIFNNRLMKYYIGELNLEDSIYTVIAPTQAAYSKVFDTYKDYFKSHGGIDGTLNAELITKRNIDSVIVNNLVFRGEYQNLLSRDSVFTTTGTIFKKNWKEMFNGNFYKASNGDIMITDNLNQNIYESVQKTLQMGFRYYNNGGMHFSYSDAEISWQYPQSGNTLIPEATEGFLLMKEPQGISVSPSISIYPGSSVVSAKYDVIFAIIPGVASDSTNVSEQTILDFRLEYKTNKTSVKRVVLKSGVITNPLEVMYVELKDVEIPYIDVEACIKMIINVPFAEREKYKKQVRIKEVTFKPAGITN